jgi:hypothetical protein
LQRVEIIERARGTKWKVRFLDEPHPGLVDYVMSKQIVCKWGDRRQYLRDEKRFATFDALGDGLWEGHPRVEAVDLVLASSGEPGAETYRGKLSMAPDQVERLTTRAGLEGSATDLDPVAFIDRHGEAQLPFRAAERLAQAFAAAEPKTVLLAVQQEEDELEARGWLPGERYMHTRLQERRLAFALARQWAGFQT